MRCRLTPPWLSGGVGGGHPPPARSGPLLLVEAAPDAVLRRAGQGVVEALDADRAVGADRLGLALPDLPLGLALTVRAEEKNKVLFTARSSILPARVGPGKHSRLPTYLRHGPITSTGFLDLPAGQLLTRSSSRRADDRAARSIRPSQDATRCIAVLFPRGREASPRGKRTVVRSGAIICRTATAGVTVPARCLGTSAWTSPAFISP